jgi:hypothetical protein
MVQRKGFLSGHVGTSQDEVNTQIDIHYVVPCVMSTGEHRPCEAFRKVLGLLCDTASYPGALPRNNSLIHSRDYCRGAPFPDAGISLAPEYLAMQLLLLMGGWLGDVKPLLLALNVSIFGSEFEENLPSEYGIQILFLQSQVSERPQGVSWW